MISKLILVFIAVVQLLAGGWAASIAFANTTLPISTLAMMGMLGSLFHSTVLFCFAQVSSTRAKVNNITFTSVAFTRSNFNCYSRNGYPSRSTSFWYSYSFSFSSFSTVVLVF